MKDNDTRQIKILKIIIIRIPENHLILNKLENPVKLGA